MRNIFYHKLIKLNEFDSHFEELGLTPSEKRELYLIIHQTIHTEILNYLLTNIPNEHHEVLLEYLEVRPHDKGVEVFLKTMVKDLEDNLKRIIQQVKQDFMHELHEYKSAAKEWLAADVTHTHKY